MILVRAALIQILKSMCLFALVIACGATLLLSYAYISGDRIDRDEMKQTADHYATYLRVIPHAEAQPSRAPASL